MRTSGGLRPAGSLAGRVAVPGDDQADPGGQDGGHDEEFEHGRCAFLCGAGAVDLWWPAPVGPTQARGSESEVEQGGLFQAWAVDLFEVPEAVVFGPVLVVGIEGE